MSEPVFEIVTYTVKDINRAQKARRAMRSALSGYPGFRAWTQYVTAGDDCRFVDVVEWDTLENARAAQASFMEDPVAAAMMAETSEVLAMSHVKQAS